MKIKQNNSIIPLKLLLLCFGESECIKWSSLFFGNSNGNLAFRQWLMQNWLILDSVDPILMFLYLYYCIMLKNRGGNLHSTLYHHFRYIHKMPDAKCLLSPVLKYIFIFWNLMRVTVTSQAVFVNANTFAFLCVYYR